MRRRHFLATVSAAGLAGCLGQAGTATEPRSDSPTPSPHDGATVSDASPCPEWPASPTRSSVERFLVDFERTYLEQAMRRRRADVTDVSHDFGLSVSTIRETDSGFRATLSGGYAVYYDRVGPTYHGDVFDYEARYAVDGGRLRRTAATGEARDPREHGQRVTCPPRHPEPLTGGR